MADLAVTFKMTQYRLICVDLEFGLSLFLFQCVLTTTNAFGQFAQMHSQIDDLQFWHTALQSSFSELTKISK